MRGCLLPLLFLYFEEGVFGVRSVANERLLDHLLLLSGTLAIFEVADVFIYQPRFLVVLVAILEDLRVLAYLHEELVFVLRTWILLTALQ